MRINTKALLKQYILESLGSPIIKVEVTENQMNNIIDSAVQKLTDYTWGTLEDTIIVELHGKSEYPLPDKITNILKVSKGGSSNLTNFSTAYGDGYVPNIWSEQFFSQGAGNFTGNIIENIISISSMKATLDKFFGDDIYYKFNPNKKVLQVFEPYKGPAVIHYQYEYLADDIDLIYNHEWLKAYCIAMTKFQWGNNIGKFDQTLVGGARFNYDRILSEAQTEIDRLNQELIDKWSDPAPISIA